MLSQNSTLCSQGLQASIPVKVLPSLGPTLVPIIQPKVCSSFLLLWLLPQIAPKREQKTIRIRDPNQGGEAYHSRDYVGPCTASTPTPPQTGGSLDDWPQRAAIGGWPGLPGPEHSPGTESQPSSPSPTSSPPLILEPGSESNLGVLSLPGDTMTMGMKQICL